MLTNHFNYDEVLLIGWVGGAGGKEMVGTIVSLPVQPAVKR